MKKGDGHDPPATWQLDFARSGAVATERQMRTHGVVVTEVSAKQASEMPLVEHNEMIEAFPADGADDALGEGILPGRVGRDEDLVHAHAVDSTVKGVAVDRVTIPEEMAWGRVLGERLDDLLGGPSGPGVVGDVDVNELATIMSKHDERKEQPESQGGDDKEIDRDDLSEMRRQESAPGGRRAGRCAAHVLGDRQFPDVITKEMEFGLDASATPRRVFASHAPNERAELRGNPRPADRSWPRAPPPVEPKTLAMPGESGGPAGR